MWHRQYFLAQNDDVVLPNEKNKFRRRNRKLGENRLHFHCQSWLHWEKHLKTFVTFCHIRFSNIARNFRAYYKKKHSHAYTTLWILRIFLQFIEILPLYADICNHSDNIFISSHEDSFRESTKNRWTKEKITLTLN